MGTYKEDLNESGRQLWESVTDRDFMAVAENCLDLAKELSHGAVGLAAGTLAIAYGTAGGQAAGAAAGTAVAGPVGGAVGAVAGICAGGAAGLAAAQAIQRNYFDASTEERERINALGGRIRSAVLLARRARKWAA